jgi:hypothetical protein
MNGNVKEMNGNVKENKKKNDKKLKMIEFK